MDAAGPDASLQCRSQCQGPAKTLKTLTRAASSARLRPDDTPTPSIAVPLLHMIAFTSAKSTLTRPGMVMMSLMPWTPCSRELRVQWRCVEH
jgi:hypothetical protein